jgi:hypothetical protein
MCVCLLSHSCNSKYLLCVLHVVLGLGPSPAEMGGMM